MAKSSKPSSDLPVALVTGAGSGIGKAAAIAMADEGYRVALVGRTEAKLKATAEVVDQAHGKGRALVAPADVTDADEVDKLVRKVVKKWRRLDVDINVAGFATVASVAATDAETWRTMVGTNLSSVVYLTAAVWEHLAKSDSGIIVNTSSMASRDPFPGFGAYAAAKAGVNMFSFVTGQEGKEAAIRCVCIAPGAVETEMLRGMFDEKMVPAEAALAPEDVAKLICDCVMGRRDFEPGQTLFISR